MNSSAKQTDGEVLSSAENWTDAELKRAVALMRLLNYAFIEAGELKCDDSAILVQQSVNSIFDKFDIRQI